MQKSERSFIWTEKNAKIGHILLKKMDAQPCHTARGVNIEACFNYHHTSRGVDIEACFNYHLTARDVDIEACFNYHLTARDVDICRGLFQLSSYSQGCRLKGLFK